MPTLAPSAPALRARAAPSIADAASPAPDAPRPLAPAFSAPAAVSSAPPIPQALPSLEAPASLVPAAASASPALTPSNRDAAPTAQVAPARDVTISASAAPAPVAPPRVAGQVFAAAMHAALLADATPGQSDDPSALVSAMLGSAPAASPATAASAPLDLRHERWPDRMIERIAALRDDADASSTRIRVSPEALGPVELSVRREGATLHVHFVAAAPETRALIADAQPRLAELAGERGLKLGQTSVGGGAQDNAGRQPRPSTVPASDRSARARAATPGDEPDTTDTRIA